MEDRRPLGSRFQDCCRTTREGGGLPETEEGQEGLYMSVLYGHLETVRLMLIIDHHALSCDHILAGALRGEHHAIADLLRAHGAV